MRQADINRVKKEEITDILNNVNCENIISLESECRKKAKEFDDSHQDDFINIQKRREK